MGVGDEMALRANENSLVNDQNGHTAKLLGVSTKGVEARREELAADAARAADQLKAEGR